MPTINNSIPYIPENVIDQAAAINEALNDIDVALQIEVEGVYNAPPTLTNGKSVIVGSTPTDEFVGHSNEIAQWFDGYWKFYPDIVYCLNKDDGNFWKKISGIWEANNKVSWGNIEGTLSDQIDLQDALDEKLNASEVGISVASLVAGKVPSEQLPSYVDDILEFPDLASFPVTGESGKIYVAIDTGNSYRWSGSVYTKISQPLDEIPKVEAETGTASTLRAITARRLFQAAAAWWASVRTSLAAINSSAITENNIPVVVQTDIGTDENQIPLNAYLGGLAYMSPDRLVLKPQSSVVPASPEEMVFELTDDNTLKIKVRVSDGTLKSVTFALV